MSGIGDGRGAGEPSAAARPRGPAHPHRRLGRHGGRRRRSSTAARRARPRRHRHHRPRADRCRRRRPGDGAGPRPAARGRRRRGGHDPRRPPARARPDAPVRPYRSLRATIAEIHDAGRRWPSRPTRSCPYPLCAQACVLRRLLDDPRRGRPPGRPRDVQPDVARPAAARERRPLRRAARAGPGRQQRRPRARCGRDRLDDVPGPDGGRPASGHRRRADRATTGRSTRRSASSGPSGEQLRKRGRDARDEVAGPGPQRRHRARPRLSGRAAAAAALRAAGRPRPRRGR